MPLVFCMCFIGGGRLSSGMHMVLCFLVTSHSMFPVILFQITITVCSQMGSLGISIAGGKGSSPCKENDEVHFITHTFLDWSCHESMKLSFADAPPALP